MYEGELRQYLKDNNGPTFGPMTTDIMQAIGVDPVFEGPQPTAGVYQTVYRNGVEQQSDGKWYTKYSLAEMDADAKAAKDAQVADSVRDSRNRLLAETDWRFRSDMTPSQAWKDYCQALRDVPAQAGFPHNVTWPTKPE
jgi:hypothetical protein